MPDKMYRVLVVDDEPQIAGLLKVCLEMHGMKVKEEYDGSKAYELFNSEKFDLVITDIMMPVMDGYELVEKISEYGAELGLVVKEGEVITSQE